MKKILFLVTAAMFGLHAQAIGVAVGARGGAAHHDGHGDRAQAGDPAAEAAGGRRWPHSR